MFRKKLLAIAALGVCAVQLPLCAQTSSPSPAGSMAAVPAPSLVPGVCPTQPGPSLPARTTEIRSEPRLNPASFTGESLPVNSDTVTTPSPTAGRQPIGTEVPAVTPSLVPNEVSKPITLDQALEIAFRQSPDIRIALDQVERSRGVIDEAKARFNPSFSTAISGTLQGPTSSVTIGGSSVELVPSNTETASASILLPLDISRRLAYSSDIARYQFQAQYMSMVAVSERVILNVKSAYFDLLRACGQQEVAQAAVDASTSRLANTQARQKAGTVPLFDLMTAQVELANLNQQLMAAQNTVYIAQAGLNRALGIDVNNPTQVIGTAVDIKMDTIDIPKNTDLAYARRPEIKVAQSAITLNKTNIKLQKTGLRPSLNLSAGSTYGFQTSGLNTNNLSWQTTLALSFPLWDGGVTKGKVREAQADAQNAVDSLDQAKLSVAQEVRTAGLNLQNAAQRTQSTGEAVSLAQEALRLANVRYEAGIATLVEVTNAQSQLTQARFNLVNAQYDYAVALAQLQRATSSQPELDRLQLLAGTAGSR